MRACLRYCGFCLWLAVWFGMVLPVAAASTTNTLVWNKEKEQMSTDVRDWKLLGLLESLAGQTGWHVYVEPDENFKSSVKFTDLPTGQALRRLLGDMNFPMMPQTNGPQRLYVFRTSMNNATTAVRNAQARSAPKAKRVPNELIVRVNPAPTLRRWQNYSAQKPSAAFQS